MDAAFTKYFPFSASRESGGRVFGHNFVLGVTVDAPAEGEPERRFVSAVETGLISRLDSRDLGLDVDFLKGLPTADGPLLCAFWPIVEKAAAPLRLRALSLERDKRTLSTLTR
ncbi:MAG TPA: hypothetical protein VL404_07265 [Candidatus Eisenbacteria bacterium]|nr:hypothetical protein [Candidatus Eisenbacteria bacterium]